MKEDTAMQEQSTANGTTSSQVWARLEDFVRAQVQRFIQALLEKEVTESLGRQKSVRRPGARGLAERFVHRLLSLFQRRTKQVGELLPQLYLHGLALGDFE